MKRTETDPFSPARLAGLELRNRFIRSGCYEGFCRDGLVTDELIEHHREVAAGGIGMTTMAYGCVSAEGRTFADQVVVNERSAPGLARLADAVHSEGAAVSIQLTHGGYFSDPQLAGGRPPGASAVFNAFRMTRPEVLDDRGIRRLTDAFVMSAVTVRDAGFDAVEVHAGHGYLLSQFLSPYTNRRRDGWGGSRENRNRFAAGVVQGIRRALGDDFPVLVKFNVTDGIRGGIQIEDALSTARALERAGASTVIPSCGSTTKTPFMMLRGKVPIREMARVRPSAGERLAARLFGRLVVKEYDYEPMFLSGPAAEVLRKVDIPVTYIGGVQKAAEVVELLAAGFEFIQVGRATIRNPAFVNDMASGVVDDVRCDACNRCVAAMDDGGVRCVTAEEEKRSGS